MTTSLGYFPTRIARQKFRRARLKNVLSKLKRRIEVHQQMLLLAESAYWHAQGEFKRLDREIFENNPGITICKAKTERNTPAQEKPTKVQQSPDIEAMSSSECSILLERLLRIKSSHSRTP